MSEEGEVWIQAMIGAAPRLRQSRKEGDDRARIGAIRGKLWKKKRRRRFRTIGCDILHGKSTDSPLNLRPARKEGEEQRNVRAAARREATGL